MIRVANDNIALATEHTLVVGGHGPVGNRAQLIEYRDMLVGIRNNVAALKKKGKFLEQAQAAKPTAAYDAKLGQFVISPALFTSLVYRGVRLARAGVLAVTRSQQARWAPNLSAATGQFAACSIRAARGAMAFVCSSFNPKRRAIYAGAL